MQIHTIWVARAISVMFPEITTIGGARQDPLPWHPNGLAIDVMIPNHNSDEGIELGNQIAGLALANAKRWGVIHVIWRQGFYPGIGAPSWTADYGNETANHYDHVHIATDGGGFPTGQETYYIGSMSPATPTARNRPATPGGRVAGRSIGSGDQGLGAEHRGVLDDRHSGVADVLLARAWW